MKRPQQLRSQETTRRILDALTALLRERPLDEIAVSEIAAEAGVSVGGFYARFSSKEDLVGHVCDDAFLSAFLVEVEERLAPERWASAGIEEILTDFFGGAVQIFRENRALLREVTRLNRTSADQAFRERMMRFDADTHRALRTVLLEHAAEIGHPDPSVAVDLGLVAVFALMRETIFFDDRRPDLQPIPDADLAVELTRILCSYLRVAPRTDAAAGRPERSSTRSRRRPASARAAKMG